MNTSFLGMAVAALLTLGFVVGLGALSLTTGGLMFLFGGPRLKILKTDLDSAFAFSFKWDEAASPVKFDFLRIRLFNPFGTPTQIEVSAPFLPSDTAFAREVEFDGPGFKKILGLKEFKKCTLMIEISSLKSGLSHQFEMKGARFLKKLAAASLTAEEFESKNSPQKVRPLFQTVKRSFVAESLPQNTHNALKIATNPAFAEEFTAPKGASGDGEVKKNFTVSKVWIEDGCIVCDACETIFPEVFEVQADTCVIRPDAPLNDGVRITEAAEACPVEVIKFS